jgi:conjugal transfer mating pair stabilization protein TraG
VGGGASFGWRQDNGAMVTGFGNGQEVFDTSGAISRLGFTPTMTTGSVAEWRKMASEAHRQAQAYENAANEILTATHANRSAFGTSTERTSGWDSSSGSQANTAVEQFDRRTGSSSQGTEERSSISQSTRVSQSHDRQAQTSDQVSGAISAGMGGRGGSGAGAGSGRGLALPGLGGSVSKSGSQINTLGHRTDDSRGSDNASTSSSGVRDEHSNGSGASTSEGTYARSGVFSRASATSSASQSTEDSLALARSYSETARKLEELSQQLSRDASYAETHGMQLSENLSQDLAQWYRQQQVSNPGLDAPELWATDLSDHQRSVRQEMIGRWMQEKEDAIRSEIAGDLHAPDLVSVDRPSVSSAADVRASYHPHGPGGIPRGPAGGNSAAAADIVAAGRRELSGARSAAEAIRGQRVQGSADIQQEVSSDHDRGFFHDPKLRD